MYIRKCQRVRDKQEGSCIDYPFVWYPFSGILDKKQDLKGLNESDEREVTARQRGFTSTLLTSKLINNTFDGFIIIRQRALITQQ